MEERREKRGKGKGGRGKEKRGWEGGRREEKMKIYFQKTIFFTLFDFHFSSSPPQRPGVPLTNSISFHPPLLSFPPFPLSDTRPQNPPSPDPDGARSVALSDTGRGGRTGRDQGPGGQGGAGGAHGTCARTRAGNCPRPRAGLGEAGREDGGGGTGACRGIEMAACPAEYESLRERLELSILLSQVS